MKTILTYEFDENDFKEDPFEYMCQKNEFRRITTSKEAYLSLYDINVYILSLLEQEHSDEVYECIEKMREKFADILEDNGVNLDHLE